MRVRLRSVGAVGLMVLVTACTQAPAVTRSGDAPTTTAPSGAEGNGPFFRSVAESTAPSRKMPDAHQKVVV